ncbi:MAG: DUF4139 domain-containing protein [Deltaproteobacteria bacterium]|nr:DUF4139 domain-containing protein [Deltaproteobacteria bacterium]
MNHLPPRIVCESGLSGVVVHARGALVTRALRVPRDLPDGEVELEVRGITVLCEPGSLRAALPEGASRSLVAVRAVLELPKGPPEPGSTVSRVRALERTRQRLQDELDRRARARDALESLTLSPRWRSEAIGARINDALESANVADSVLSDLDGRVLGLRRALEDTERLLEAALLEDAQATSRARQGEAHPTRGAVLRLAGSGAVASLSLTYAVPAARWWPVYTLRLSDAGKRARWIHEALVAQRSGEDWTGVALALSTADMVFDARLPTLPSLRLGRAQPPSRSGWREPPADLDRLFVAYDKGLAPPPHGALSLEEPGRPLAKPRPRPAPSGPGGFQAMDSLRRAEPEAPKEAPADERALGDDLDDDLMMPVAPLSMGAPKGGGLLSGLLGGGGGGAPMAPRAKAKRDEGRRVLDASGMTRAGGYLPGPSSASEEPSEPGALEPSQGWQDYDRLRLAGPEERGSRGRLRRVEDTASAALRAQALAALEGASAPERARDPLQSRGLFDHRYEAEGKCDVPSDGGLHRVPLGEGESPSTQRWRTVPRERPEVYRELELRNPFDAPLLAGPVEVYLDGSLLAVDQLDRIDRGGTTQVGLGVEERVKVARNVTMTEDTAGLLKGDTVLTHTVSIELSSALGTAALVDVVDRVPVSDDKTVELKTVRSAPEGDPYTQTERGEPLRGGRCWRVIVAPGAKARVEYTYTVTIPSRNELVGGNRRD